MGGHRLLEPGHRLGPVDTVGFVALAFTGADPEDRAPFRQQVKRRRGLRRDRRIASSAVGDADAQSQTRDSVAGREVSEHRPRLHDRVDGRREFRCAGVLWVPQGAREEAVQVIRNPERVDSGSHCGQIVRSGERVRGGTGDDHPVADPDAKSTHCVSVLRAGAGQ